MNRSEPRLAEHALEQGTSLDRERGSRIDLLRCDEPRAREAFSEVRGHRAIGVVYHPQREHRGNFVPTALSRRYDALLHIDETQALHPLHIAVSESGELPETFPSAV